MVSPMASPVAERAPAGAIDLLDGDLYAGDPDPTYVWLRRHAPLYRDETNRLWGVSRYHDVVAIEKDPETFCSSEGYRPNIPADDSMIGNDDPRHNERRRLVARRFTPKAVAGHEDAVREVVRRLVDEVAGKGRCEVVEELAAPLPALVIARLLGFDDDQWPRVKHWSEATIVAGGGPRYMNDGVAEAFGDYCEHAARLMETRQAAPVDDVMSVWMQAEADGTLTTEQVLSEGLLLVDGGAETTRTVIARTILDLIAHPEQWQALKDGADLAVATEEFIRWVTPIHNMCRVAAVDADVGGQPIEAGQQLVLMYSSGNRDPAHFADPERYDVARSPNNHIAFGFGTHFCLGAALARMEIRVFFAELVRRVRSLRLVPGTAPVEMPNAFVYGLRSAHVEFDFEPA
jgi:cholest-4-en-3-one 26-monooxygenase